MLKYIIGTISKLDRPLSPEMKVSRANLLYIMGRTAEERQKVRDKILSATSSDIRDQADLVQAVLDENAFCVVGNEDRIKEASDMFDTVRKLIQ